MTPCRYESPIDKPGKTDRNGCSTVNGILNSGQQPLNCRTSCGTSCNVPQSLCWSSGDPHFMSFQGPGFNSEEFDFQEAGEFKLLESVESEIKVHVYHFPWSSVDNYYTGAVSNIFVALQMGPHSFEIRDQGLYVNGTQVTDLGNTAYADGTQVYNNPPEIVLTGPASATGYANLRIVRRAVATSLLQTGYYYNLYARLPTGNTPTSSGLCRSQTSGSTAINVADSLFSS